MTNTPIAKYVRSVKSLSAAEIAATVAGSIAAKCPVPLPDKEYLKMCAGIDTQMALSRVAAYAALLSRGELMMSMTGPAIDSVLGCATTITGVPAHEIRTTNDAIAWGISQPPTSPWFERMLAISNTRNAYVSASKQMEFYETVCPLDDSGQAPEQFALLSIAAHKAGDAGHPDFTAAFSKNISRVSSWKALPPTAEPPPADIHPSMRAVVVARKADKTPWDAPYFKWFRSMGAKDEEALLLAAAAPYFFSPVNIKLVGKPGQIASHHREVDNFWQHDFLAGSKFDTHVRIHESIGFAQSVNKMRASAKQSLRKNGDMGFAQKYGVLENDETISMASEFARNLANRTMSRQHALAALMGNQRIPRATEEREIQKTDILSAAVFKKNKSALTWVFRVAVTRGDTVVSNAITKLAMLPLDEQDKDETFFGICQRMCANYGKRGETAAAAMSACRKIILDNNYVGHEYLQGGSKLADALLARARAASTYRKRVSEDKLELQAGSRAGFSTVARPARNQSSHR